MATLTLNKSYDMRSKLSLVTSNSEPGSDFQDHTLYVWDNSSEFQFYGLLNYDGYSWDTDSVFSLSGYIWDFKYLQGNELNSSVTFEISDLNVDFQDMFNSIDQELGQTAFMETMLGGYDTIIGTSGNDTLMGYSGSDHLISNGGTDTLIGGTGYDTYVVNNTSTKIIEKEGEDGGIIQTDLTTYSLAKLKYVQNLEYTGEGNSVLTGNTLMNILIGNSGNDTLDGGIGNDTLFGNEGADKFVLSAKYIDTNWDFFMDFDPAEGDQIVLSKKIFKSIAKSFTADNFVVGDRSLDSNDYLYYNPENGFIFYDADGNGTKMYATVIAKIGLNTELSFSDLTVA